MHGFQSILNAKFQELLVPYLSHALQLVTWCSIYFWLISSLYQVEHLNCMEANAEILQSCSLGSTRRCMLPFA